ncbi:unnamed protein product, partial [Rotaria socialis]
VAPVQHQQSKTAAAEQVNQTTASGDSREP